MLAFALLVLFFGQYFAQTTFYNCEADPKCQVLATGLSAPRHLDAVGQNFYVAESGSGGDRNGNCFDSAAILATLCLGYTGGIRQVSRSASPHGRGATTRILTAPSLATETEQLGVSGIAVSGNDLYFTVGFDTPEDFTFPKSNWFGTVRKLRLQDRNCDVSEVADVAAYEIAHNPDRSSLESNAQAITQGERQGVFYVVDAAGNTVYRLDRGTLEPVAIFDDYLVEGQSIDFVPTAVKLGRDGNLYVSNLVGVKLTATGPVAVQGAAKIVRVRLDRGHRGQIEDFATGFTNIIDFDILANGQVLVAEISHTGILAHWDGAVWKVSANGQHREALIGANSGREPLFAPGGIKGVPGQQGFVVTEGATSPDQGRLLFF